VGTIGSCLHLWTRSEWIRPNSGRAGVRSALPGSTVIVEYRGPRPTTCFTSPALAPGLFLTRYLPARLARILRVRPSDAIRRKPERGAVPAVSAMGSKR